MKTSTKTNRSGAISPLAALTLLASLSFSAFCFWKGAEPAATPLSLESEAAASLQSQTASSETSLKPISEIRVGERVTGENPGDDVDTSLGLVVEPATWKKLTLKAPKDDGSTADVVLLRPDWWLEDRQAEVDGTVYITVPECGIDGNARILSIADCPPVASGDGHVVTGTFRHASAQVVDVHTEGSDSPIGTTANHPFWSEDRQDFVRADELQPGERLKTLSGIDRVSSVAPRGPPEPVFNIEVLGQHVYQVADNGVLVHNGGPCPEFIARVRTLRGQGLQGSELRRAIELEFPSRTPIPGDANFAGPVQRGWRLADNGMGAHLVERVNVKGRSALSALDQPGTPRFYPHGTAEAAGAAHVRLHQATRNAGIRLRRGQNALLSDAELLGRYRRAYSDPSLNGILGDLRTPDGTTVIARNVNPTDAIDALLRWADLP